VSVHELRPGWTPPVAVRPHSQTAQALRTALALLEVVGLPEPVRWHVHGESQNLTFDYSGSPHAAGDVACAAKAAGVLVEEFATETIDGEPAIELRAQEYLGGLLRTFRAVVPLEPKWGVL
jgi:hypothetical protein